MKKLLLAVIVALAAADVSQAYTDDFGFPVDSQSTYQSNNRCETGNYARSTRGARPARFLRLFR